LVFVIATAGVGEKYSEFYILGANGKAEDYPRELYRGQKGTVILGVINHEQTSADYRMEITIEGVKTLDIGPISLNDTEKWEDTASFSSDISGLDKKVEFLLYKGESIEPYLTLHLWINIKG
jgi:uncharacterized membrane protein